MEAAEGAALPLGLVDEARAVRDARVHLLVLHGALEEALARLAREQAVVVAADAVAADRAQLVDALLRLHPLHRKHQLAASERPTTSSTLSVLANGRNSLARSLA